MSKSAGKGELMIPVLCRAWVVSTRVDDILKDMIADYWQATVMKLNRLQSLRALGESMSDFAHQKTSTIFR
jgi:hypothetical protein